jgi:hypothetical protein
MPKRKSVRAFVSHNVERFDKYNALIGVPQDRGGKILTAAIRTHKNKRRASAMCTKLSCREADFASGCD